MYKVSSSESDSDSERSKSSKQCLKGNSKHSSGFGSMAKYQYHHRRYRKQQRKRKHELDESSLTTSTSSSSSSLPSSQDIMPKKRKSKMKSKSKVILKKKYKRLCTSDDKGELSLLRIPIKLGKLYSYHVQANLIHLILFACKHTGKLGFLHPAVAKLQNHLKSFYLHKSVANDDKLLISPSKKYINLAIIKHIAINNQLDNVDEFTKGTLHGGIDEIVANKESITLQELFSSTDDSLVRILVEGPPGIGKSTFAWELCRNWDSIQTLQKKV